MSWCLDHQIGKECLLPHTEQFLPPHQWLLPDLEAAFVVRGKLMVTLLR